MITKNLILMGKPGAGKGTVAEIIAKEANLVHLSTGFIFRNEIQNKTELGQKVEFYVNSGGYVPDEITNEIVKNAILKLKNEKKLFILDGYPRTISQAKFLKQLPEFQFQVIQLTVSDEVILERLSGRRSCKKFGHGYHIKFNPSKIKGICDIDGSELMVRTDDKPEKIINRLNIYNQQTQPLLNYYKNNNELIILNGEQSPKEVAKKIYDNL
ncbi:adenylate kinase [Mycoplasmopsis mustelae]|uniref:Adenylate kinase n=1 Tax=Mycoplasmopsis mustelae TaxID=171289 RepID=A0A4R7UD07_9BACT|nr:nucleoside monophosphate kinase [Mycoplasmopsis mustelae]TDV24337.1 adenylate kinase [Mycoplasmopsis mustelae]